ncbi:SRPBCC domain-containing protein [Streptomyces scabiei]|uniref:SRPBCC domain-containing protein n=1 Tax=Streptomyces scabiei TaxID=1930 RepID=UPI0029BF11C5|nr:SRPBCC domain-containing protein [Streptomyces scabiei]MDX3114507.1 SRPBCC domain-containing protein [Streptomyces scabiei]
MGHPLVEPPPLPPSPARSGNHHEASPHPVIDIDATPQAVWDVLTDFAAYGEWSTFSAAEGTAQVGSRLTMRMPGMTFRPTVTVATPGQELRWVGTLGIKQLFHGQHAFVLSPNHDGTTRLTNHEEFSGAPVTLIRPFLRAPEKDGYAAFNTASSSG